MIRKGIGLAAAVVALAAFPSAASAAPACGPARARTLAQIAQTRVYTTERDKSDSDPYVYGCFVGHRPVTLAGPPTSGFGVYEATLRLAGRYAAFAVGTATDGDDDLPLLTLVDLKARTKKVIGDSTSAFYYDVILKPSGSLAWIVDDENPADPNGPVTTFVRKREAGKAVATLDAGNVLKGSLALARKTLYWTKDRKPYSGTFA